MQPVQGGVARGVTPAGGPSRRGYRVVSPAPRAAWREVLQSDPEATVFQTPEWLDGVCRAGRYTDASRLYELADGRRAVLPVARRVLVRGTPLFLDASLPPQWGQGGVVAEGGASVEDIATVAEDLSRAPAAAPRCGPTTRWRPCGATRRARRPSRCPTWST
jgi:hypothetical protein